MHARTSTVSQYNFVGKLSSGPGHPAPSGPDADAAPERCMPLSHRWPRPPAMIKPVNISLNRTPGLPWPARPLGRPTESPTLPETGRRSARYSRLSLISGTTAVGPPLERHAGRMLTTKVSPFSPGYHGPSARVSAQRPKSKNHSQIFVHIVLCSLF